MRPGFLPGVEPQKTATLRSGDWDDVDMRHTLTGRSDTTRCCVVALTLR